jgi:rare lipoprotein A
MIGIAAVTVRVRPGAAIAFAALLVTVLLLLGCAGHAGRGTAARPAVYVETGMASYYAGRFHNRRTASGERFDNTAFTAAHRTLPFGTEVIVRNLDTGKSVRVRINDRGPFVSGRIIDLSNAAFARIARPDDGLARVEIRVVK